MATEATAAPCEVCGRPALVRVLVDQGFIRRFCLECADHGGDRRTRVVPPLLIPNLLIRVGAVLGVLAIGADYLGIAGRSGFGWRQAVGAELGVLCLVIGAFVRRGWPMVIGIALLLLSMGADVISVGETPGMGWRQHIAMAAAILMVSAGLIYQQRDRRRLGAQDRRRKR
jgi:hypothetical protein